MSLHDQVVEAREAGYSDDDIAKFLADQRGFGPQVDEARKAGYSSADVINYLAPKPPGFFEGTGAAVKQAFGEAGATVARGVGMAASTVARGAEVEGEVQQRNQELERGGGIQPPANPMEKGIDIGSGQQDYDDTLSQAILGTSDRLAKQTSEYWQPKPGTKMGTGAQIVAGAASAGTGVFTAPLSMADRAAAILEAGGTLEDAVKAGATEAAINEALQLVSPAIGARVAARMGLGGVTGKVAGAATGAAIGGAQAQFQPAIERAVAPGAPESAMPAEPTAESTTASAVLLGLMGAHGAKGEAAHGEAQRSQDQIKQFYNEMEQKRPGFSKLDPQDQLRVVTGQPTREDQARQAAQAAGVTEPIEGAAPAPAKEGEAAAAQPAPIKSAEELELERLRGDASTPEQQAEIDEQIKQVQQRDTDRRTASGLRTLADASETPNVAKGLMARAEELAPLKEEAERLGIDTQDRSEQDILRDVRAAEDHAHAAAYRGDPEDLAVAPMVRQAAQLDPLGFQDLVRETQNNRAAFLDGVGRIIDAGEREGPRGYVDGAEPGPGGPPEQPEVRGEHPPAAAVEAGEHPVRGEQGVGGAGPGEHPEAGPEVPEAGAERGGAPGAEAPGTVAPRKLAKDEGQIPPGWKLDKGGEEAKGPHWPAIPGNTKVISPEHRVRFSTVREFVRGVLGKVGLDWVHEYPAHQLHEGIGRTTAAHVELQKSGRIVFRMRPSYIAGVGPEKAARTTLHEYGHVLDEMGHLYSQEDDMRVRRVVDPSGKKMVTEPVGQVAKEIFALAQRHQEWADHFRYPLDPGFQDLHQNPAKFQAEMFAQLFVARAVPKLREAMTNEAPAAKAFIDDAIRHGTTKNGSIFANKQWQGKLPAPNIDVPLDERAALDRLALDSRFFAATRSRGRGSRSADGGGAGLRADERGGEGAGGGGEERPLRTGTLESKDLDPQEIERFRHILNRNYSRAQLKRMGDAMREEDKLLASGQTSTTKGLQSLPPDQREAVEFLQGRGYEASMLPARLGGYVPYSGVQRPAAWDTKDPIGDALARVFAPATRGMAAGRQAGILRANLGIIARYREEALHQLASYARRYDKMPREAQVAFWDAIDTGQWKKWEKSTAMAKDAQVLRDFNDFKRDQVHQANPDALANWDENWMGRMWLDPDNAEKEWLGDTRRNLQGSKAFLKRRSFPRFVDGLRWRVHDEDGNFVKSFDDKATAEAWRDQMASDAVAKGWQGDPDEWGRIGKPLEPVTTNPFEMAMLKGREMDRYIAAQRIAQQSKAYGMWKFVPKGKAAPDGWAQVDDKIAQVSHWSEAEKGFVDRGAYYAPEEAATLVNNHLSPGLRGNSFYESWRRIGAALNSVQLGLSFFHLGFTSLDAMTSRVALGMKQVSRGALTMSMGDVGKGLGNIVMGMSPHQPIENLIKGDRLLKAYIGDPSSPEMAPIVDALQQAGGRAFQDDFYRNTTVDALRQAFRRGDKLGMAKEFIPTVLDRLGAPIFDYVVPRQKLGVFFDMAKDWLQANPNASVDERRQGLGKLWDSVDNRMGQLVYDNLFWNKTLKDALMATVRSVGWNLGTFREIGGGVKDILNVKDIQANKSISDRASYIIALPFLAAVYGAVTQWAYGQGPPKDSKDLFFPRTGRKRPDGSEDRVSLPTYMKDIYAYGKDITGAVKYGDDPTVTLQNKAHPMISTIAQMLRNEDYYGAAIRNPGDPATQQALDEANYLVRQMTPFSIRNYQQQQQVRGGQPGLLGYATSPQMIGITPAPGYITKTPEQQESGQVSRMREPLMRKFREELQNGMDRTEAIRRMYASGLSKDDVRYVLKTSGPTPAPHRLKHFGASP